MTNEIFAKRLVELREKRSISQQQLADAIGVTRQSLSLYERAERTINIELLAAIAKYFGVTSDYLLGLSDVATPNIEERAICEKIGCSERALQTLRQLFGYLDPVERKRVDKQLDALGITLTERNGEFESNLTEDFIAEICDDGFLMENLLRAVVCRVRFLDGSEREEELTNTYIERKHELDELIKANTEKSDEYWEEFHLIAKDSQARFEQLNRMEDVADTAEWRLQKTVSHILERLVIKARERYVLQDSQVNDKVTGELVEYVDRYLL
ncbi:MAG: helix-turn-helix transcriptional regulator [Clostridia bacterium]|nr:helix-turn-helix transcriptional regulator [Clostridia bacterium]